MKVGELFTEKVKVLRGFDRTINKPVIEEVEIAWEVVEICDDRRVLAKSQNGEFKMFLIQ